MLRDTLPDIYHDPYTYHATTCPVCGDRTAYDQNGQYIHTSTLREGCYR